MQLMHGCCSTTGLVSSKNEAHIVVTNQREVMMTSIVFFDHVVDRYITQSRRSSWEARLENYRKWVRNNDHFTWPLLGG